jgi:hypothetical protein
VALSPDVVSFVHDCFGYCDLRRGGGIANVAGQASSIDLAAGTARNAACCFIVPEMTEANPSDGGFSFMRPQLPVLSVLSSWNRVCRKGDDVMTNSEAVRQRANASFKRKEIQAREGASAMADYEAAGRAVEEKTARLKALRLAGEEFGRQAEAAKKSRPPADDAARRAKIGNLGCA